MCDYSLHCVASRVAQAAETLMVTNFRGTSTRGFASPGDPTVAVCLRPGTEIAFEQEACREGLLFRKKIGHRVARFRQVELENPTVHHDALGIPRRDHCESERSRGRPARADRAVAGRAEDRGRKAEAGTGAQNAGPRDRLTAE